MYLLNSESGRESSLYVGCLVASAAQRSQVSSSEKFMPGSRGLGDTRLKTERWSKKWNAQADRYHDVMASPRRNTAGVSWVFKYCWSNCQLFKRAGNVLSQCAFSQGEASGEQQMKLPFTDEAHVSYADRGIFARGYGFPRVSTPSNIIRGCRKRDTLP